MNGDARLIYSSDFGRWQGEQPLARVEGGVLLIWMDDPTFSKYVRLLLHMQGLAVPTQDERQMALRHCQDFPFWLELAKVITDSQVTMRELGGAHPGNYQRETMPQGDALQWSALLQCWVARHAQGTLWVPKASFLRQEAAVAYGSRANSDHEQATPTQYQAATEVARQCRYWDSIDDPQVLRLLPGEVPYANK